MTEEQSHELSQLRQQLAESRVEVERLKRRLDEEVAPLNHLIHIGTQLTSTLKLSELLRIIMSSAKDVCRAEACSIALLEEETGDLVLELAVGEKSDEVQKQRIPSGKGIAGRVLQTGEPMIANSVEGSPYFYGQIDQSVGYQTRNILAVPLKVRGRVIGVVEVINAFAREGFDERDRTLAMALANQAAVAIDNAGLYEKLAEALVTSRMSYRL